MYRFYQFSDYRIQRLIGFTLHGGAAVIIFFYLQHPWLQCGAFVAIALDAVFEHRRLIRQGIIRLRLDPVRRGCDFEQAGQSYFYSKYKVYQTRWFAILKLVDQRNSRVLILHPGSFDSPESYRRMRFDLHRLERRNAA